MSGLAGVCRASIEDYSKHVSVTHARRYTEFLAACLDWKRVASEGALQSAFDFFDADGSGTIDRAELVAVLGDEETEVRGEEGAERTTGPVD